MQNLSFLSTIYAVNKIVFGTLVVLMSVLVSCTSSPEKDQSLQQSQGDAVIGNIDTLPPSQDTPQLSKRPTVLFIGTSLTAGYGLGEDEAYPAQIELLARQSGDPVRVVNAGVSGETSAGAVRRMGWALKTDADIVVLETGANDGLRGLPLGDLKANIESIIDSIESIRPQARIVLIQMEAPPNMGAAYSRDFRAVYEEIAERRGVILAPFLLDGVAGVSGMNLSDGLHPNREGAKKVAANVWKTLHSVVKEVKN